MSAPAAIGHRDERLMRIVAMVDGMAERGDADALVASMRTQLSHIRPVRPPSFQRLLFTPLDPVITPGAAWQAGTCTVPRVALLSLAAAVRDALPALANEANQSPGSSGPALWSAAAPVIDAIAAASGWAASAGLPPASQAPLQASVAAVLAEAGEIDRLAALAVPPEADLANLLHRATQRGPDALATTLSVLASRLSAPDTLFSLARSLGGETAIRSVEAALTHMLASLHVTAAKPGATAIAREAARLAALFASLAPRADRAARAGLEAARRDADQCCLGRFGASCQDALAQVTAPGEVTEPAILALEATARDLRRIETAGRQLGSADRYQAMLANLAEAVRSPAFLVTLADRVRLTEILCGPEQALALLDAETP